MAADISVILNWENADEQFLSLFPRLREQVASKFAYFGQEKPGQYVFFGDVAVPFVAELFKSGESHAQKQAAADFIERLATSADERLQDLFTIEFLPAFLNDAALLSSYWHFAGPKSRWWLELEAPRLAPDLKVPPEMR